MSRFETIMVTLGVILCLVFLVTEINLTIDGFRIRFTPLIAGVAFLVAILSMRKHLASRT